VRAHCGDNVISTRLSWISIAIPRQATNNEERGKDISARIDGLRSARHTALDHDDNSSYKPINRTPGPTKSGPFAPDLSIARDRRPMTISQSWNYPIAAPTDMAWHCMAEQLNIDRTRCYPIRRHLFSTKSRSPASASCHLKNSSDVSVPRSQNQEDRDSKRKNARRILETCLGKLHTWSVICLTILFFFFLLAGFSSFSSQWRAILGATDRQTRNPKDFLTITNSSSRTASKILHNRSAKGTTTAKTFTRHISQSWHHRTRTHLFSADYMRDHYDVLKSQSSLALAEAKHIESTSLSH